MTFFTQTRTVTVRRKNSDMWQSHHFKEKLVCFNYSAGTKTAQPARHITALQRKKTRAGYKHLVVSSLRHAPPLVLFHACDLHGSNHCQRLTAKKSNPFYYNVAKHQHCAGWINDLNRPRHGHDCGKLNFGTTHQQRLGIALKESPEDIQNHNVKTRAICVISKLVNKIQLFEALSPCPIKMGLNDAFCCCCCCFWQIPESISDGTKKTTTHFFSLQPVSH